MSLKQFKQSCVSFMLSAPKFVSKQVKVGKVNSLDDINLLS